MKCPTCGADMIVGTQACPRCGVSQAAPIRASSSSVFGTILMIFAGFILVGILLATSAFAFFRSRFSTNAFYQESLAAARASTALQKLVGEPIQEGWLAYGVVQHVYGSDFAEWTIPLKGPKGRGRLYGVANRIGDSWHPSRLVFVPEGSSTLADISPPPARDPLFLGESKKRVYLIPLGPVPEEFLAWAPDYYKAKFALSVEVLPALPLSAGLSDPRRRQLVAERLLKLMKEKLPEKVRDQEAVLVGVTAGDMYITSYDWNYAINFREEARFGVVSTARLAPVLFFQKWNQALAISRLQKMLTKNIYLLCYDTPMSSDYTSAVSGGVMSPAEVDSMSDQLIGAQGRWNSLITGGDPTVSMVFSPDKPVWWKIEWCNNPPADVAAEYFGADLKVGLLIQRRTDFYLDGDFPLQFVRVYRNESNEARAFGIGTSDSLDLYIAGEPGKYVQLTLEDGTSIRFDRSAARDAAGKQAYKGRVFYGYPFSQGLIRMTQFDSDLATNDGWHYLFPYRSTAKSDSKLTALTGYSDPEGRRYEMERNDAGDLLSITTPGGKWLHFEHDDQHRFRRIEDSEGRVVNYDYDSAGRLIRVSDSAGGVETYLYDEKNQLRAVLDGKGNTLMSATYSPEGYITGQTLGDGQRFEYEYLRNAKGDVVQIRFTSPRGYVTLFNFSEGEYTQSLPSRNPDAEDRKPESFLE